MEFACFHEYPFVNHSFHHSVFLNAMVLKNRDLCSYLCYLQLDSRNSVYVVDYEAFLLVAILRDDSKTKPKILIIKQLLPFRTCEKPTCILASGNPILDANRSRANTSG